MATFDPTTRVQDNIKSAAIAAGFLLFFGFFYGLQIPTEDDLFSLAGALFIYTLRIGGLLMVGITVWSAIGHPPALLCDGIVCSLIGLSFIGTGIAMLAGGGEWLQTAINVVCGTMFVASGMRNGRDYLQFAPAPSMDESAPPANFELLLPEDGDTSLLTDLPTPAARSDDSAGTDEDKDAGAQLVEMAPKDEKGKTARSRYGATSGRFAASEETISLADLADGAAEDPAEGPANGTGSGSTQGSHDDGGSSADHTEAHDGGSLADLGDR